jgi:uncharacterized membrane protein YfcA
LRINAAIGSLAGLASGLLGVGGGFLIVPLLTLWARADQRRASGTSLAAILPISIVAAATYYFGSRTPQTDLPMAAALVVGGAVGVIGGALAAQRISERVLRGFVAILLFVVGLKDVRDAALGAATLQATPQVGLSTEQYLLLGLCGLGIGVLSGLAGLGGGVFIVPLLVTGFGVSQRIAQGTSLIAVLPTAAIGAIIHEANGWGCSESSCSSRPCGPGRERLLLGRLDRRLGLARHHRVVPEPDVHDRLTRTLGLLLLFDLAPLFVASFSHGPQFL